MKKVLTFISDTIVSVVRFIASLTVLVITIAVWGIAASLAVTLLEKNLFFAILVFPCGWFLLGFTGLFYQGAMKWLNPEWEGVEGGYDGLHYESETYDR